MKKLLAIALVVMFLMPAALPQAFAAKETVQAGITDVGNKLCPVSGDPVSGKNFVTYHGKRYGLCCPMCEGPFLKNPKKYIAQMKVKERVSAAPKGTVVPINPQSKKMEKAMEQGSL